MNILGKLRAQTALQLAALPPPAPSEMPNGEHENIWGMVCVRHATGEQFPFDHDFIVQKAGIGHAICYATEDSERALDELDEIACEALSVTLYAWDTSFYEGKDLGPVSVKPIRNVMH